MVSRALERILESGTPPAAVVLRNINQLRREQLLEYLERMPDVDPSLLLEAVEQARDDVIRQALEQQVINRMLFGKPVFFAGTTAIIVDHGGSMVLSYPRYKKLTRLDAAINIAYKLIQSSEKYLLFASNGYTTIQYETKPKDLKDMKRLAAHYSSYLRCGGLGAKPAVADVKHICSVNHWRINRLIVITDNGDRAYDDQAPEPFARINVMVSVGRFGIPYNGFYSAGIPIVEDIYNYEHR